ncbi:MAG: hypothetical protein AAF216_08165, partial [Pseudomonadota bacterium]
RRLVMRDAAPDALALGAPTGISGDWTLAGGFRTLQSPVGELDWWGSWSGSDANQGELVWSGVDVQAGAVLQFQLSTGPSAGGMNVLLRSETGEILDQVGISVAQNNWLPVEWRVETDVENADIVFSDAGSEWGQWMAVSDIRLQVAPQ